jgi:hypothetical protein
MRMPIVSQAHTAGGARTNAYRSVRETGTDRALGSAPETRKTKGLAGASLQPSSNLVQLAGIEPTTPWFVGPGRAAKALAVCSYQAPALRVDQTTEIVGTEDKTFMAGVRGSQ